MSAALRAALLAGGAALAAAAALFVRERAAAAREEKECEEALAEPAPAGTVRASVLYARKGGGSAWFDKAAALAQRPPSVAKAILLRDGRAADASLDTHGAECVPFDVMERPVDATDPEICAKVLFPAAERLLERVTGCARAVCFDHIVRVATGPCNQPMEGGASGPINFVHNDYSVKSGVVRARALLGPFATSAAALDAALAGRVAIINVWAPLEDVESDPLAFVDWRSLHPTDCRVRRVRYDSRTGETTSVYGADRHEWLWFPRMKRGEAFLLKTWDTKPAGASRRSLYAAHSSAALAGVDATKKPRKSVEMRCFCLFDDSAKGCVKDFVAPHIARIRSGADFYETVEEITYFDEPKNAWFVPATVGG